MPRAKRKRQQRRKYDDAFKADALNQIEQGRSPYDVAKDLGVPSGVIYRWRKAAPLPKGFKGNPAALQLENELLRKQNAALKSALLAFLQAERGA